MHLRFIHKVRQISSMMKMRAIAEVRGYNEFVMMVVILFMQ